jgi:2-keto-4-pentenoate hydratase
MQGRTKQLSEQGSTTARGRDHGHLRVTPDSQGILVLQMLLRGALRQHRHQRFRAKVGHSGPSSRQQRLLASAASAAAATAAANADTLVRAWATCRWIDSVERYPPPPDDLTQLYAVHAAMAEHPLVASELGGLGGWKVGAVGALGQPCIYAPLFRRFFVREGEYLYNPLTVAAVQMHQVEPEIALVMGRDLDARCDGVLHSQDDVWAAVESVNMSIECCGQRGTSEVMQAQAQLGRFQDSLAAGGLVLGNDIKAAVSPASLAECVTELSVNGAIVATGSGGHCPQGGPVAAATFLANELNTRGLSLRAGEVVATGQTCMTREFGAGDSIGAQFYMGSGESIGLVEMVVE